jgi:hypothetical protein
MRRHALQWRTDRSSRRIERWPQRVYLCPMRRFETSYVHRRRPPVPWRASVLPLLLVAAVGCTTRQVANRSVLEAGAGGDRGVKVGRLPACEKGQVAGDGGQCLDVAVTAPAGQPATMRERLLLQDCEKAKTFVVSAVRRRDQVLSTDGHDVHLGLNAIAAECRARQEQLDVCTRAGRYGAGSRFRSEEVRLRDGLATCRELADVYRDMLAKGLRRAP